MSGPNRLGGLNPVATGEQLDVRLENFQYNQLFFPAHWVDVDEEVAEVLLPLALLGMTNDES